MKRTLYTEEHKLFRDSYRKFLEKESVPFHEQWEEDGMVSRELWTKAGEQGFLGVMVPEEYGGMGADFKYAAVINEETVGMYQSGFGISLHNDIVVPYIQDFGSPEQKKEWLPKCVSGEVITAIDMTEPGTGSDLAALRTTAKKDGTDYILNGQKTFITNGLHCDMAIVAAKTNPEAGSQGVSLFLVPASNKGFVKGKKLKKIGLLAQDTAEHYFEDCRVPQEALLGQEGAGFMYLMKKLQQERLIVAIMCVAGAQKVYQDTVKYCKERQAFGKNLHKFQHIQFKLVEVATELEINQVFLDRLIEEHTAGKPVMVETCMAKWYHSEMFKRVSDTCLQFFGGYGYMREYPISKAYVDSRVQMIYAGTNEIMKLIIAKSLGL